MDKFYTDIFTFITSEEGSYNTPIQLPGNWSWHMKDHLETTYLYNNSQLKTGKDDFKPVKNITRPILNLQHRAEDIEVRDVAIYVDDPGRFHLSFLVKKYHDDVFVVENDIDMFLDELNISRIDYGAGLSKKTGDVAPEVIELHSIAFCDQTDILSGPIGIKHFYNPSQLLDMAKFNWGSTKHGADTNLQTLIQKAQSWKKEDQNDTISPTPGKYVEVYEVHGSLPKIWLDATDTSGEFVMQMQIVAMGENEDGTRSHHTLFKMEQPDFPFKLTKRDSVYGRALGFGGAEELFEAQVWTNYDMIRKQDMLDAASKTILKTTDPNVAGRNKVKDMDNLDIVELQDGTDLSQVDTFPRNIALFDKSINDWQEHAQQMGAASDAVMGQNPTAGTPFKLQNLLTQQGLSLHEYRRGQYARHLEEIYTDWIIPHIEKMICKGQTFLSELSLEEMQYVTERLIENMAKNKVIEMVIAGEEVSDAHVEEFKQLMREDFKKGGNKRFLQILKDEFKGSKLRVKVSVRGKSKDLGARTDSLVNVFRQIIANPGVLRIPAIARIFNDILESSGMSPADFTGITEEQLGSSNPQNGVPGTEQPAARGEVPVTAQTPQLPAGTVPV